jgi:hypothetical protein
MVVHTNGADNGIIHLTVYGFVEKFATVRPERAFLNGPLNKKLSVTLEIIPEEKYPFTVLETSALNGGNITFKLEKNPAAKSSQYFLTVKSTAKAKGKYFDLIIVKTDNKIHPEIRIPVLVNIL